jgi:hypothetical protein
MTEKATGQAVQSGDLLDTVVTIKGESALYRVASFLYLHWLAWHVLCLGTQDISHRCLFRVSNAPRQGCEAYPERGCSANERKL